MIRPAKAGVSLALLIVLLASSAFLSACASVFGPPQPLVCTRNETLIFEGVVTRKTPVDGDVVFADGSPVYGTASLIEIRVTSLDGGACKGRIATLAIIETTSRVRVGSRPTLTVERPLEMETDPFKIAGWDFPDG